MTELATKISGALKSFFGYDSFRPLQQEVIQQVLQKKDALLLMPTGGGKSICYQIPTLVQEGLTIVISPLISLMSDQVAALNRNGVKAAALHSAMSMADENQLRDDLTAGRLQILYTSPERFVGERFQSFLHRQKVHLFAIDEAHCISVWGHQFRPEYRQLSNIKRNFPDVPILALTATADLATRRDIKVQLGIEQAEDFISSFDRANIAISVRSGQKRFEQIVQVLEEENGQSGIIYCLSRKSTESLAGKLKNAGFNAAAYHAGLDGAERERVQKAFLFDKVKIICATVAFGMGIDKSNVRYVMHYNVPKNIEGYYQEIGRAGRDGLPSKAILFFSYADINILQKFARDGGESEVQISKLERMVQFAQSRNCRRQMILNYFNESGKPDCDNCDNCQSPPEFFEGTIEAQKILSAIYRMKEKGSVEAVAGVLRGANTALIRKMEWDKLKTDGIGNGVPKRVWLILIEQLLHKGHIRIAYENHNTLKLMEKAKSVLFQNEKVEFYKPNFNRPTAEPLKKMTKAERLRKGLGEKLKEWRGFQSQKEGVPAYVIFNDATLVELATKKPVTPSELLSISGVGQKKLEKYGSAILDTIIDFRIEHKDRNHTHLLSWKMLRDNLSPEEIADKRQLSETTIYGHLARLHSMGFDINLLDYISQEEVDMVSEAIKERKIGESENVSKVVYEYHQGNLPYHIIRLGIAYLNLKPA